MRYFGYGSNLDIADLRRWCGEKGLALGRYEPAGVAFLPDHRLAFHYFSPSRAGGALDVTPARGRAVPGVLFDIDDESHAVLERKEGGGVRYERREVTVLRGDGAVERAFTYRVMEPHREARFVAPTAGYTAIVRRGLAAFDLPAGPFEAAAAGAEARFPAGLFVYGTLKRGHCRGGLLASTEYEPAVGVGELVDLGPYPALRCGESMVYGELHRPEVQAMAELLARLDPVEDFGGWERLDRSMYHRAILTVRTERGPELAWTYLYRGREPRPVIADGVWRGA